jgi:SPP1 gp7 family putative phage head morphogenesis protein
MGMDDRISSVPQWDISYLEGGGNFDVFDKTFDRLEVLKLRSIWIPEQAFLEGSGGTSSRNVAAQLTDNFQESQAVLMGEFDDHLNRYVIPQLVKVNFPNFEGECKKVTKGFGPEDIDFAKNIVQLIGAKDPDSLEVDTRTLMDQIGIPLKSPEVVEAEREKKLQQAIEEAQAMQPPEVAPTPGQAGTIKRPSAGSATGFEISYIQPNESIVLAEGDFTSKLPDTNHYKDESILGITKATRQAWKNTYEEAYEDFAQFIDRTNFAEDDSEEDAEREADRILSRWKYSFDNAVQATVGNVKKIISRAGSLELRRARFSTENWNPNDAPAEWAERHGASLVKGVTETTRNELRRFLAKEIRAGRTNDEIAQNIRDHFSTFPTWKADRLARTETMLAYNFATLFAGQAAGVTRVQALDGLRGPTEEDCENRNGKIFDISDAFGENLKEHPNGTLAWRLLRSTNLSVEKVPRSEIEDDKLAWFDPITDTIYIGETLA